MEIKEQSAVLHEARKQGIADVVLAASDSISLETLKLATELTKKHGSEVFKRLEERRNS